MINFPMAYRKLYRHLDTYSGAQFLKIIQGNDPGIPDFQEFIHNRRLEGKSTIRKDYFKDVLFAYPDTQRLGLFELFLKKYEVSNPEDVQQIRVLLEDKPVPEKGKK